MEKEDLVVRYKRLITDFIVILKEKNYVEEASTIEKKLDSILTQWNNEKEYQLILKEILELRVKCYEIIESSKDYIMLTQFLDRQGDEKKSIILS